MKNGPARNRTSLQLSLRCDLFQWLLSTAAPPRATQLRQRKPQLGRGNENKCLGDTFLTEETMGGPRRSRGTPATSRAATMRSLRVLHSGQPSREVKGAR